MLTEKYETPSEINSDHKIEIDTGSPMTDTIKTLYQKLIDRQIQNSAKEVA